MKKIVPFNNVLTFNTDICEITAISLEHDIKKEKDAISGVFYISGEYKITDGQLDKDKFNFELPFDVALGSNYDLNTLDVDIDDFRYEQISRNELKVNIDLYIDGEIIEEVPKEEDKPKEEPKEELKEETRDVLDIEEPTKVNITENLDLLDEILDNKEKTNQETNTKIEVENENNNNNDNENNSNNIFNSFNEEEEYVTYKVHRMEDKDTLDNILEKYKVSKEELSKYNNLEDIHPGVKLIIPYNGK